MPFVDWQTTIRGTPPSPDHQVDPITWLEGMKALQSSVDSVASEMVFASRTAAKDASAATGTASFISVYSDDGRKYHYIYDDAGTALTTGDGRNWLEATVGGIYNVEAWVDSMTAEDVNAAVANIVAKVKPSTTNFQHTPTAILRCASAFDATETIKVYDVVESDGNDEIMGLHIDFSAARISASGSWAATDFVMDIRARNCVIHTPGVDCADIASGIIMDRCITAKIYSDNIIERVADGGYSMAYARVLPVTQCATNGWYRIKSVGTTDFTAIGAPDNDVGTRFKATGTGTGDGTVLAQGEMDNSVVQGVQFYEHMNSEDPALRQGVGVFVNAYDLTIKDIRGGWCKTPILIGEGAAEVTLQTIHPFNGSGLQGGAPVSDPTMIKNWSKGDVYINDAYYDNGLIHDLTGGNLKFKSGHFLEHPTAVSLTSPYVRVYCTEDLNGKKPETQLDGCEGLSVGFYDDPTGTWSFAGDATAINTFPDEQELGDTRTTVTRREVRAYTGSTDVPTVQNVKMGGRFVEEFHSASGGVPYDARRVIDPIYGEDRTEAKRDVTHQIKSSNVFQPVDVTGGTLSFTHTLQEMYCAGASETLYNATGGREGDHMILRAAPGETILVKHDDATNGTTGKFYLGGADITLWVETRALEFIHGASNWILIGAAGGGSTGQTDFESYGDLKAAVDAGAIWPAGTTLHANGAKFMASPGATAHADAAQSVPGAAVDAGLTGLLPTWPVTPEHWGFIADGSPGQTDAFLAAANYVTTAGVELILPGWDYLLEEPVSFFYLAERLQEFAVGGPEKHVARIGFNFDDPEQTVLTFARGDGQFQDQNQTSEALRNVTFYRADGKDNSVVGPCVLDISGWGNSSLQNVHFKANNGPILRASRLSNVTLSNIYSIHGGYSFPTVDFSAITVSGTNGDSFIDLSAGTLATAAATGMTLHIGGGDLDRSLQVKITGAASGTRFNIAEALTVTFTGASCSFGPPLVTGTAGGTGLQSGIAPFSADQVGLWFYVRLDSGKQQRVRLAGFTDDENIVIEARRGADDPLAKAASDSVIIGTGTQNFTIATDLTDIASGEAIVAYADKDNYMVGMVTSYTSGTGALVMNVTEVEGTGTHSDWGIVKDGLADDVTDQPISCMAFDFGAGLSTGSTLTDITNDMVLNNVTISHFGGTALGMQDAVRVRGQNIKIHGDPDDDFEKTPYSAIWADEVEVTIGDLYIDSEFAYHRHVIGDMKGKGISIDNLATTLEIGASLFDIATQTNGGRIHVPSIRWNGEDMSQLCTSGSTWAIDYDRVVGPYMTHEINGVEVDYGVSGDVTATVGDETGNTVDLDTASWRRLGRTCWVNFGLEANIITSGMVSGEDLQFSLPFPAKTSNIMGQLGLASMSSGTSPFFLFTTAGTDKARVKDSGAGAGNIKISDTNTGATDLRLGTLCYEVADGY